MTKSFGDRTPPSTPQVPRVAFSIPETAAALGVGRTLVYKFIEEGQLKSLKLGKRHMITAQEIQDFLGRMGGAA